MIEIEILRRENARQQSVINALTTQMSQMTEQIAKLNDRIAELLAVAQRRMRGPEKPKPQHAPVASENLPVEVRKKFDERPQPPEKPAAVEREAKKQKPTGRSQLPRHLKVDEHALYADACKACGGGQIEQADVVVEEKLHVVHEHMRIRRVKRTTCRCRDCGARTTPRSLPAPYQRSKVTCEFLAWLVHQKFRVLTPLERIRLDLGERGIPLAMGSLVKFIERAADILAPVDGYHWKQLLEGKYLSADATGLKVLIPDLPKAHNGYIELFRNDDITVFLYEATKAGEHFTSKLSYYDGTVTVDAEHRMNDLFKLGKAIEAGCNAHGRRKFHAAEETQPLLAVEGGRFIGAMYGVEDDAKRLGLKGEALTEYRQKHTRPIADAFDRWLHSVNETLLPTEPLKAAVRYYINHREALYRFIDDGNIPIDNSPTEREFQNVAKLRFNMLFAGSTEGAHRACVLLGIVGTCRAIGVSPQAYMAWAFERLGTHRDAFNLKISQVTPAAFKEFLSTSKI